MGRIATLGGLFALTTLVFLDGFDNEILNICAFQSSFFRVFILMKILIELAISLQLNCFVFCGSIS